MITQLCDIKIATLCPGQNLILPLDNITHMKSVRINTYVLYVNTQSIKNHNINIALGRAMPFQNATIVQSELLNIMKFRTSILVSNLKSDT